MKFLHTSDWHLGQRLYDRTRQTEHRLFLEWLLVAIDENSIDALIIAGDIFDNGNPPQYALKQYYDFLLKMQATSCRHIIIIGGNHDSVSLLNAPQQLLSALNINVVGGVEKGRENMLIQLRDSDDNLEAIIAAVPFLRDRDIHYTISGESMQEREGRIRQGIINFYKDLGKQAEEFKTSNLPILATGHLFAAGSSSSESEKDIYIGNLGQVSADQFPEIFSYVALGHLHRAQLVGKQSRVRYSGSPLPFSFSEAEYKNKCFMLDYSPELEISEIDIPKSRSLKLIADSYEETKFTLQNLPQNSEALTGWLEIQITDRQVLDALEREAILACVEDKNWEILSIKLKRAVNFWDTEEEEAENNHLSDLDPIEVFQKKCEVVTEDPEKIQTYKSSFSELLNWMQEQSEEVE